MNRTVSKKLHTTGVRIYRLAEKLFPLCRSITGNGVRHTLKAIQALVPLTIHEVPSNSKVYDWVIPKEWHIRDAYVKDPQGKKIIDFKKSNLSVVNYSIPVHTRVSLKELKMHLYTLPDHPDWIPYRTSYYKAAWGFCLTHTQLRSLRPGQYEAVIDVERKEGSLTYGEYYYKGTRKDEVLFSTYVCHPSLANDNLSGPCLLAYLVKYLRGCKSLKYSYRFLFVPETIGALTWLSRNEGRLTRIKYGLVVSCVGDRGPLTYKRSRQGNAPIDRIVEKVLADSALPHRILDFSPLGSDERQYCSPGFDLPVGVLMRTPYGMYPEYHTSADNLAFIAPLTLGESFDMYVKVIETIERDGAFRTLNPRGEPFLGKRNLYQGKEKLGEVDTQALFWVLNYSDGTHSLLDIAVRSSLPFAAVSRAAELLRRKKLIAPYDTKIHDTRLRS